MSRYTDNKHQFSSIWDGASTKSRATLLKRGKSLGTMTLPNNVHLPSTVEPSEFRLAQQPMEDMPHFVEERHDIVVAHERGLIRGRLRKIGNHGRQWVTARTVGLGESRKNRPHGGM